MPNGEKVGVEDEGDMLPVGEAMPKLWAPMERGNAPGPKEALTGGGETKRGGGGDMLN